MAYSPFGIYVGLSQVELDALRASAIAAITNGHRTSMSGGGKSSGKEFPVNPRDVLAEIIYAEQISGRRPARAQKVVNVLSAWPNQSLTPNL